MPSKGDFPKAKKNPAPAPQAVEGQASALNPGHSVGATANKAYRSAATSASPETHILDITQQTIDLDETLESVHKAMNPQKGLEDRDALVMEFLPLVKYIAIRIAGRLPSHVELDDLIDSGIIGLIDAAERFEPGRNVKFKTYAELRVRGAILDGLRELDWVPRGLRRKKKDIEEAYHALEQQQGRAATDEEAAKHLGMSLDELHKALDELKGVTLGSFEDTESEGIIAFIADPDAEDPHVLMAETEVRELLKKTIEELPSKERLVVQLYYFNELTMKEIGEILKITESRVSQLHTKAMLRLRGKLRGQQIDGR
jgi:RNA polymerase sigma factor for flagellar operon FliA